VVNNIVSTNKVCWCLATKEPAGESVLSSKEIEEIELKEKKQREKEKLEQAVRLRESEEATDNSGTHGTVIVLMCISV